MQRDVDPPADRRGERPDRPLRLLHVVVQATPTNSQWNEHCLPHAVERDLTVCSLLPSTVPDDPAIVRFEGDGSSHGAVQVLRRALRHGSYDAVHVHAPASVPVLLTASALEHRPLHDVVFTLHNSWRNLRPRNRALAAVAIAAFPFVVACSESAARSIPRTVRRLARGDIHVVPNGVDVDRIDRAQVPGADTDGRHLSGVTALNIGRLIPLKDHATMLDAFAAVAGPDDRLVVVGEGPLRQSLERQARALGIDERVELRGLLARDDVYRLFASADFFVSPSRGEGLPLAVLEAMAAGLPPVLSDIPPHREIVHAADVAQLAPAGDVAAFAAAMERLRLMDASERAQLGARSRSTVVRRFSLRAMADEYARIYEKVAGPSRTKESA